MAAEDEVRSLVTALNDAWVSGRFDELTRYFHPDVVLAHPGFGARVRGRDALIGSYREFASRATIKHIERGEIQADLNGDSAVTVMPWRMKYEYEGLAADESGWDLLVLDRIDGQWQVVWRTVVLKGHEGS